MSNIIQLTDMRRKKALKDIQERKIPQPVDLTDKILDIDMEIQHHREKIGFDRTNTEHLLEMAEFCTGLNSFYNASGYYHMLLDIEPDRADVYFSLGQIFHKIGDREKSAQYYKKAVELDSSMINASINLATVHSEKDDYDSAVEILEELNRKNPGNNNVLNNLAVFYAKKGNNYHAMHLWNEILKRDMFDVEANYNQAVTFTNMGLYDAAVTRYKKIITIGRDDGVIHNSLGILYEKKGEYVLSNEHFAKSRSYEPENLNYQLNYAVSEARIHNLPKAISLLEGVLEKNPYLHIVHIDFGLCYALNMEFEKALECWQKAERFFPENSDLFFNMALAFTCLEDGRESRDYSRAIEYYQKTIKADPDYEEAYLNLGELYLAARDLNNAIAVYSKIISVNNAIPMAHFNLGMCYYLKKQYARAKREYMETIRIDPENIYAYQRLTQLYCELGERSKAVENYRKMLELEPGNPVFYFELGEILMRCGRLNEGIKVLSDAVTTNVADDKIYYLLGYMYYKMNITDKASEFLSRAMVSENPELKSSVAQLLAKLKVI